MSGRVWRILAEVVLVLALTVVAAATFSRAPAKQAGDEANWIGTARYFLVLFVHRDVSAEAWPDDHWTRTQPMIPRYIMGGWLWTRGIAFEHFDPYYDHTKKWFTNVRDGKAPTESVLDEARIPMRALTAISAVLLYGVVRVMAGPVGGTAAALLFCGSSYVPLHMVRAMGEPPFITFLLATLLVSLIAIARSGAHGPSVGLGIAAGVLLGLALSSKLTAIVAIIAIALWGAWNVVGGLIAARLPRFGHRLHHPADQPDTVVSERRPTPAPRSHPTGRRALVWSAGVIAVACLTFVATNPYLYHDPIGRSWLLFYNRQAEMSQQAEIDPSRAVGGLSERVRQVWTYSLIEDTWAHTRLRWPLEAVLAIVGFAWLVARAVRLRPGADGLLLLWTLGFFGGVTVGLGYMLDHYFMPTATIGILLGGLAVGWSFRLAWQGALRLVSGAGIPIRQRALTNSRPPFSNDAART
jgi:hypothetical protein